MKSSPHPNRLFSLMALIFVWPWYFFKTSQKNITAAMTSRWAISRTGSQPYKGHGVMDRWMMGTYSVILSATCTNVHFLNLIKWVYVGTPRLNKWELNASLHRSTTDMQTEAVRWPKVRLHVCKGKLLGCVPQIHLQHLFTGFVFCLGGLNLDSMGHQQQMCL